MNQGEMVIYCDIQSAINMLKNQVQHSNTKHIDIRHHFIRELVEKKEVRLEYISIEKQLANIFTKALNATQIEALRSRLGLCVIN